MNIKEESLKKHYEWKGKIETKVRVDVSTKEKLSLAYTPGVAEACLEIKNDESKSFDLTRRWNTVPVITDGTAVLGLGDIGPSAGMPVMEGKCALFKEFGDVDAFPICINSKDEEEIIKTIKLISKSFGGINLEDISAPRCFEIEKRLIDELDIPVFHDDQHGTAIVVGAALLNALELTDKKIEDIKVVINGAGAAGLSIAKFLIDLGVKHMVVCDKFGIINDTDLFNQYQRDFSKVINTHNLTGKLVDAIKDADVFIGVSVKNVLTKDMVKMMNNKPIIFPMANPEPEITYQDAIDAGAYIVGTGSSQNPNQINNVLVFPGLFRGVLDARCNKITKEMMIAACYGIKNYIKKEELRRDYIIPYAFDKEVHKHVARSVYNACIK